MIRHVLTRSFLGLTAAFFTSCASTRIVNRWKDPGPVAAPYQKVLVVAAAKESSTQRTMEDDFVRQLSGLGVKGVASYTLTAEAATDSLSDAQRKQLVSTSGCDAAILIRLVRIERDIMYSPSTLSFPGDFYGYWGWTVGNALPVSSTSCLVATVETKLFDAASGRLLWAASSQTDDLQSLQSEIANFARVIIHALQKDGYLPSPTPPKR